MQQLSLFDGVHETPPKIELAELFEAYAKCRSNKRNTANALAFEVDYEAKLLALCNEINNGSYQPDKSIAFIVTQPVKREIFAADFRDRVVHHLVVGKLNSIFERSFIHDNYACRAGKGAHFGIQRAERFIRRCSHNYTQDCYVLKLDIKGFFMHINKRILIEKLKILIEHRYTFPDKTLLLELCEKIVNYEPTENCIVKSKRSQWDDLPKDKSLFHTQPDCGLPIGNLTSQVFANVYMNSFDHFIKHECGMRYYGRYVDDFILVHQDKEYLKALIPRIQR